MAQINLGDAPASRSISQRFSSASWVLAIIVAAVIAYILLWKPVPYADDYDSIVASVNSMVAFAATFAPRSLNRLIYGPLTKFFFTSPQIYFQLFLAGGMIINALLVGWLSRRVLRSTFAGIIASWLFVMPFFAYEALTWTTGNNFRFTFPIFLSLHAFVTAYMRPRRAGLWIGLGILAYTLSVIQMEYGFTIMLLLPVLAWAIALQRAPEERGRILRLTVISVFGLAAATLVYFMIYYAPLLGQSNSILEARGTFDLNPLSILQRIGEWFNQTYWITLAPGHGSVMVTDSYQLGAATLTASLPVMLLFVLLGILIILTVILLPSRDLPSHTEITIPGRCGIIVAIGAVLWGLSSIVFPGVLLTGEAVASRFLYFATAGFAISISALAWLLYRQIRLMWVRQIGVALAGVFLLISMMIVAGYGKAFELRYNRDLQQISGLVRAAPPDALSGDVYLLPYNMDEFLIGQPSGVSESMFGIFEAYWATPLALDPHYERVAFRTSLTNRWSGVRALYSQESGEPTLTILGATIPIRQILPFTYQNGIVALIPYLRLNREGQESELIEFPLVKQLRPHSGWIDNGLALDVTAS